jgi:hypothetical protein
MTMLSTSSKHVEELDDRTADALRGMANELLGYRQSLKSQITVAMDALVKATSAETRLGLDEKLKELYLKLSDVDLRVASIEEKLAVSTSDEKDNKIRDLTAEVQRLHKVVAANKQVAQNITENAKKI